MLDLINLRPEEAHHDALTTHESTELIDALDLAITPANLLAVGWTLARGEFEGLRVDAPVRMSEMGFSAWL